MRGGGKPNKNGHPISWVDGLALEGPLFDMGTSSGGEDPFETLMEKPKPESDELGIIIGHFDYRIYCLKNSPSRWSDKSTQISRYSLPRREYAAHHVDAQCWLFEDFSDEPFTCQWSLDYLNPIWGTDYSQEDLCERLKEYRVIPGQVQLFQV